MGAPNLVPVPKRGDWRAVQRAIAKLGSLALGINSTPTFAELTIAGELTATGINAGYIDFDITATPGDGAEGRTKWNAVEHTLDLTTGLGPVLQVGQESFVIVYNNTGSTIYNGTAVYPIGAMNGRPLVTEAAANTHVTFAGVVLITTMDIPTGTAGIVSQDGKVRGVDTTGFDLGDTLWLSEDGDGILNNLTNVRPSFPSYAVQIGGVAVEDAADGVIQLELVGKAIDTHVNFFNGTFREPFDFRVTESGGTVTGTLTPSNGHPDMTMIFHDGFTVLDTDPGATLDLTAYVGTDTSPATAYVFVPQSTKVLTVDTSWPVTEHIRVAELFLQSAVTTGAHGALRNQNWNDEIQNTDTNQGHASHLGQRLRAMIAEWNTGAEATLTVGDTANSYVSVTSGKVFQMHEQTYPALSMPTDSMEVVNDPDGAYTTIITLDSITKTSDGVLIPNNRWISIVIWGVANKSGETSHIMCNVPSGTYTSELNAQNDALGYSNYNIPKQFKGVGFLIARFTVQRKTSTIAYGAGDSYQDLRGFIPNSTAGSGAGGSGISTFLGLTDTPSSFVGEALSIAQVNAGETALEFTSTPTFDSLTISGAADTEQLVIKANASQTLANPMLQLQDSGGTPLIDMTTDDLSNLFIGADAGSSNTVNVPSGGYGTQNLFIGKGAGENNTSGWNSMAIGYEAMNSLTTGNSNFAVGTRALFSALTASNNFAMGTNSLYTGAAVTSCLAVGASALYLNTGNNNFGMGLNAAYAQQAGVAGVYIGTNVAGQTSTPWSGSHNIMIGWQAGYNTDVTANNNLLLGSRSGYNLAGSGNVFLGYNAGHDEAGSNKLYIENTDSATPLIYGEFDNDLVQINGDLTVVGDIDVSSNDIINIGAYDYKLTSAGVGSALAVYRTGGHTRFGVYSDATYASNIDMYQGSDPDEATNYNRWRMVNTSSSVLMKHEAVGTHSYKPVHISTAGYSNQLVLDTSGDVSMSGDLDVTGEVKGGTGDITGLLTVGSLVGGTLSSTGTIKNVQTATMATQPVSTSNDTILVDTSSNSVTVTLPLTPVQGVIYTVKCIDATNTCTVGRNGNNIDGAASDITLALNESVTVQYDGTFGWAII